MATETDPKKYTSAEVCPGHDTAQGTVEALGYHQDYRRVLKTVGNIALVLSMAS